MFDRLLIRLENTLGLSLPPCSHVVPVAVPLPPLPLSGFALFVFLLIWLFFHVVFRQTACFFPFLSPAAAVTDMEEGGQPGAACPLPVPFPPSSGRQQCPWGRAGAGTWR